MKRALFQRVFLLIRQGSGAGRVAAEAGGRRPADSGDGASTAAPASGSGWAFPEAEHKLGETIR